MDWMEQSGARQASRKALSFEPGTSEDRASVTVRWLLR